MVLVSSRNCAFIFCSSIRMGVLDNTIISQLVTTSKFRLKTDYRRFQKEKLYLLVSYILQLKRKSGETRSLTFQHGFWFTASVRPIILHPNFNFKYGRWPTKREPTLSPTIYIYRVSAILLSCEALPPSLLSVGREACHEVFEHYVLIRNF